MSEKTDEAGAIGEEKLGEFIAAVDEVLNGIDIKTDLPWSDAQNKASRKLENLCTAFLVNIRDDLKNKDDFDEALTEVGLRQRIAETIEARIEFVVEVFEASVSQDLEKPEPLADFFRENYVGKLGSMIEEQLLLLVNRIFEVPQVETDVDHYVRPDLAPAPEISQAEFDRELLDKVDRFIWSCSRGRDTDLDSDDKPPVPDGP
jgi:hypothetical protein